MASSLIVTKDDAETYFNSRLFADVWDQSSDQVKMQALTTAFNKLNAEYSLTDLPDTPDAQKQGVYEMALYLLKSGESRERRAALQAENVKRAGIVEETYDLDRDSVMIPSDIQRLLKPWKSSPKDVFVGITSIYRDENS